MEKMRFHWENESENKKGTFTVEAMTIEECMKLAEEEIEGSGAEMVDWYSI